MIRSSMRPGSMPERSTAAFTEKAASCGPGVALNSPRWDLASGVRAVETMTASRMVVLLFNRLCLCGSRRSGSPVQALEIAAFLQQLYQQRRGLPEQRVFLGEGLDVGQHLGQAGHVGPLHGAAAKARKAV